MKTYFKLAWRNLWRNKTRTFLTTFIVLFVVLISSMMSSQQFGIYDQMIENITELSGHLELQDTGYKENKTINYTFEANDDLISTINDHEEIIAAIPRLESFSLSSYGDRTKGVAILGIDPELEKLSMKLDKKLVNYIISDESIQNIKDTAILSKIKKDMLGKSYVSKERLLIDLKMNFPKEDSTTFKEMINRSKIDSKYLANGDDGVILGEKLAKYLRVSIGDTLTLIGQGYHGVSAAGLFPVKGFVKLPMVQLERRVIFMNLPSCQQYFSAYGLITSFSIRVKDNDKLDDIKEDIQAKLPGNLVINTWEENQVEALQMIQSDKAGGVLMKGIFYMIVGFIIFGTVMMMMSERKREFGILISIGLLKKKLSVILFIETLLVSCLGAILGILISYPILTIMSHNPIPLQGDMASMMEDYGFEPMLFFANSSFIFYRQAIIIFSITIAIFLFPLLTIKKLNVIKSIRS